MNAIRFEPTIGAELVVDRRQTGSNGELFADMLGDQMKKRVKSEPSESARSRHHETERRRSAEAHPHGKPIRPIIKHGPTLRGEARAIAEDTPRLPDEHAACGSAVLRVAGDGPNSDNDPQVAIEETEAAETIEETGEETSQPPIIAQDTPADDAVGILVGPVATAPKITIDAEGVDSVQSVTPSESGTIDQTPQDATASDGAPAQVETVAGFAAALAASLDETTAEAITADDSMAAANGGTTILTTAEPGSPVASRTERAAIGAATIEPAAESAELETKITPEAPRAAEPAKPRPLRPAALIEAKAQAPAAAQSSQSALAPHPVAPTPVTQDVGAEDSSGLALGRAFDAEGNAVPGWTLHLAQGAAAKRPDFIAQLRQHLQDLPAHEQVAVNIQRALREGTGRLSIQLSPAELGKIHVKLEIDEEKRVTAAVTVEKPSTLELLQRDARALERALQEAGLKMDRNDLSFSLGRQDGEGFARDLGQSARSNAAGGSAEMEAAANDPAAPVAELDTASGLVNLEV